MKKRNICIIVLGLILVSLIVILLIGHKKTNNDIEPEEEDTEVIEEPEVDLIALKVDETMSKLTLEQKIAQMFIITYDKKVLTDSYKKQLNTIAPGGYIFSIDGISTFNGTRKLIQSLQANSEIPLIISMDEEGGRVQRLEYITDVNVPHIPSMYNLGKTKDTNISYNVGKIIAHNLRTIGVNVNFAPDSDIFSNKNNTVIGDRSFGSSATLVSNMSVALAKGMEDNGVIATFKHFPGHGDTAVDSHVSLPIIKKTYSDLQKLELIPFQNAIDNGAKIIMIGHIALPKVTGDNTPASLSKKIITEILKDDMGFKGLVITDALNMNAVKNYSSKQIILNAVNAGVDLILMPDNYENAIKHIKNYVSEERIDESVRKILTFKYTYLEEYEYLDKSYLDNNTYKKYLKKIPGN